MPFDLDPEGTLTLTLPTDAHLPESERPAFVFRFLTRRKFRRYQRLRERGDHAAALALGLDGWENVVDAFDPARLPHVVGPAELRWLADEYPGSFELDDDEQRSMTIAMYKRYGKFCRNCGAAGKCVNPPSLAQCIHMGLVCRLCKGDSEKRKTCAACGGWGRDVIISCPLDHIQPFAWELLQTAEFAEKGFWPASPAMLENTESCIRAVRWTWWLESHVKAEMAKDQ